MAERFDDLGGDDDTVRLRARGADIRLYQGYDIRCSILTQPAAFSVTVGHAGVAGFLIRAFPPDTPFELLIGERLIQSGRLDGPSSTGSPTVVSLRGRDALAPLHDGFIEAEQTFKDATFLELTQKALDAVGLGDVTIVSSNLANRKAIAGTMTIVELRPPTTDEEAQTEVGAQEQTQVVYRTLKASLGTRWYDFLKKQYDRTGLFLWAAADGTFVLSAPNGQQKPIYRLVRRRGQTRNEVNVLNHSYSNETTHRFTEALVYGRGGGGKHGRAKVKGRFIDDEMVGILNPDPADQQDGGKRKRPLVVRDEMVRSNAQAKFMAQRKIAETRREGFSLQYTLAGHTVPQIGGGRVVWTPDTTVEIDDQELDVKGIMYLESVTFSRRPETTTLINLMRVEDLLFDTEDLSSSAAQGNMAIKGLDKPRIGVTDVTHVARAISPLTGHPLSYTERDPSRARGT